MHRLFHRILFFQFHQILAQRLLDLGGSGQLFARNPTLLGRIGLDETSVHREIVPAHQTHSHALLHDLFKKLLEQLRLLTVALSIGGRHQAVQPPQDEVQVLRPGIPPASRKKRKPRIDRGFVTVWLITTWVQSWVQQNPLFCLKMARKSRRTNKSVYGYEPEGREFESLRARHSFHALREFVSTHNVDPSGPITSLGPTFFAASRRYSSSSLGVGVEINPIARSARSHAGDVVEPRRSVGLVIPALNIQRGRFDNPQRSESSQATTKRTVTYACGSACESSVVEPRPNKTASSYLAFPL